MKVGTTALVLALIEDDAFDGRRPDPGQPGAGHPPGLARPHPWRTPSRWPTADGDRPGAAVGALRSGPQVRRGPGPRLPRGRERGPEVLQRWEDVLHGLETDPSIVAGPGGLGGQAPSSSRPTASATASTGTTTAWRPWTSSTTTCARSARCSPGSTPSTWSGRQDVLAAVDRAAPPDPGLFPGPVPQALGVVGGQRQLGLAGFRPGDRSSATRPYDGSAPWNSRTRRGVAQRERHSGGAVGTVERVREWGWQNGS